MEANWIVSDVRGAEETAATAKEMRKKAGQIAPAYNKGPLQYLLGGIDKNHWPAREQVSTREARKK